MWLATLAALCLAACGGGGGGGGGGSVDPAPTPAPTTSGLVPAAPALGAVLEAQASALRPLADGATWTYHGTLRRLPSEALVTAYTSRRSQRSTATGFDEAESNGANDGESSNALRIVDGRVELPFTLTLPGRPPEAVVGIELRSPVRAGDQYVSYDRRITGVADLDADGRTDAIDAAVYARVIGRETVELPSLPAVEAVRVEFTTQVRARYSRDNSVSPVDVTVQRLWYARGLGIVRAQLEEDRDTLGSRVVAEEWLVAHNRSGVALGPGAVAVSTDPGDPVSSLSSTWRAPRQLFTWPDRVLVAFETGFSERQLTGFDRSGQLLFDRPLGASLRNGVQSEDGVAFLNRTIFGAGAVYRIHAVDRNGLFVGPEAGVTVDLQDPPTAVMTITVNRGQAYTGRQLWLSYSSSERVLGTNDYIERTGLRAVDVVTGAFATPFVDLGVGNLAVSPLVVAGGALHQVRSRIESDGSKTLRLMSLPIAPLGTPRWQVLASGLPANDTHGVELAALVDGGVLAVWKGSFSFAADDAWPGAVSPSPGRSWSGVQIRPDGRIVRGGGSDRLAAIPDNFSWLGVRGNRAWFGRAESSAVLLPGTPIGSWTEWLTTDLSPDVPWASGPAQRLRVSPLIPGPEGGPLAPLSTVWFDDRLLLIGGVNPVPVGVETRYRWAAQPYWLPAAAPGN